MRKLTLPTKKLGALLWALTFTAIVYLWLTTTSEPSGFDETNDLEKKISDGQFVYRRSEGKWERRKSGCGDGDWFRDSRRVLINYADNCCQHSQNFNCQTGLMVGGFDVCIMFNPTAMDDDFKKRNAKILQVPEGAGLWLWKPYVIYKTLLALDENDVLLYTDSGTHFVDNFDDAATCLLAKEDGDVAVFGGHTVEKKYSKGDTFLLMDCLEPECYDALQIKAAFMLFRKTARALQFVSMWLGYAQDYRLIGNEESKFQKNFDGFVGHRNDQSIASILAKKWNIEQWPDPSNWGDEFLRWKRQSDHFKEYVNRTLIQHTRDKS